LLVTSILSSTQWVNPGKVVPTANLVMAFSTLVAVVVFMSEKGSQADGLARVGLVHWSVAVFIYLGALITATLGARHQHKFSMKMRQYALVSVLILMAIKVAYSAWVLGA